MQQFLDKCMDLIATFGGKILIAILNGTDKAQLLLSAGHGDIQKPRYFGYILPKCL